MPSMVLRSRNITSVINALLTTGEGLMKQHSTAMKFQVLTGAAQHLSDKLSCLSTTKTPWGFPLVALATLV